MRIFSYPIVCLLIWFSSCKSIQINGVRFETAIYHPAYEMISKNKTKSTHLEKMLPAKITVPGSSIKPSLIITNKKNTTTASIEISQKRVQQDYYAKEPPADSVINDSAGIKKTKKTKKYYRALMTSTITVGGITAFFLGLSLISFAAGVMGASSELIFLFLASLTIGLFFAIALLFLVISLINFARKNKDVLFKKHKKKKKPSKA
jgi:hypothetical protein